MNDWLSKHFMKQNDTSMKRNEFLKTLGFGSAVLCASEGLLSGCMDMSGMNAVAPEIRLGDFTTPLPIPPTFGSGTVLNAHIGDASVLTGKVGRVMGYGNGILGPTIRVQQGSTVTLPFTNGLSEDTNIHWHGLLVPSNMDGHPDQMVKAGQSFTYSFTIDQPAGMAWYHPHPHMNTGRQVFMGLAGMFIVESPEEKKLNLPVGEFELPLVIQDKRFDSKGGLVYNPTMGEVMIGYMGDTITVNGASAPLQKVTARMYRLRVLNGSNARIYNLALSSDSSFTIIGSDSGMLTSPETVKSLLLAPGERVDLLVDFSTMAQKDEVYLQSNVFTGADSQGKQSFRIMKFVVDKAGTERFQMPGVFPNVPTIPMSSASRTRKFDIGVSMEGGGHKMGKMKGMHSINGKTYESGRIDESVILNNTEIWEFDNSKGDEPHPMHIHGVSFQVLGRVGGRGGLSPHEKGWKDTVLVMPKEVVRVIMRFQHAGKFVFHCHNLEHEDDGMMLNFEVK